jgi:hypothetical protein
MIYAISSWKAVNQQQRQLRAKVAENEKRTLKAHQDIGFIIKIVVEGQVGLTEAAIRLSALKLALPVADQQALEISAFQELAEATSHIPILKQWQQLPREKQIEYDNQREQLEALYQDKILQQSRKFLEAH